MARAPGSCPYREVTPLAIVLGIIFGVMLAACFTYAGLLMGFTVGGSAIAAILGFGVLRGIFRRGTIVENNINQTVASGINIATPGVIFTVPAFYLMRMEFDPVMVTLAAVAGALLGVFFIIPIRKQMIDLDRLRFPTGVAVATVLKSPGAGVQKAVLLVIGIGASVVFTTLVEFPALWNHTIGWIPGLGHEAVEGGLDVGRILGLAPHVECIFALSLFSLGAGFITGRPGLVVLAGGVLAYWIVTPVALEAGWLPADVSAPFEAAARGSAEELQAGSEVIRWVRGVMNRPIGIGMLVGGALSGILLAFPSIKAAISSLRRIDLRGGTGDELPLKFLYFGIAGAFLLLFLATFLALGSVPRSLLVAGLGTAWLALAGVVVAQATGMTDWSPISGIALISIVVALVLTDHSVTAALIVGVAVCVAVGECADMMQDLRTGHLVGARPIRQQLVEVSVVGIGPVVSLIVIAILAQDPGIGPDSRLTAPQAQAIEKTVAAVVDGKVPWAKYAGGLAVGGLLSLSGIAGLGVLVGLSMYLPLQYILPYGVGCILNWASRRFVGLRWVEERGVPLAAGLIVGEPLVILVKSVLVITGLIPLSSGGHG